MFVNKTKLDRNISSSELYGKMGVSLLFMIDTIDAVKNGCVIIIYDGHNRRSEKWVCHYYYDGYNRRSEKWVCHYYL